MRVLVALAVAVVLPCFAFTSQESCEDAGGRCVDSDNSTGGCTALIKYRCPSSSHVCCQRNVKPRMSKVYTCQMTRKCLKKRGNCVPIADMSLCPASSFKRKKICESDSCVCCIEKKKCKASQKCLDKKGFCFRGKKGKGCAKGLILRGGCTGKRCDCCIPALAECSPLPKCKDLHGSCIAKKNKHTCRGVLVRKACLGKGCICCVPEKTTPQVTTTPVITTTTTTPGGCRCGIINEQRIVGGEEVDINNKYPWVVGLDVIGNSSYDCVGNIINDRYILTAAHCLYSPSTLLRLPLSDIRVGIADHDQSSTTDDVPGVTRLLPVQEAVIFANFSPVNVDFDIALLKLEQPLPLSEREIGPICLPANDDQTYGGDVGTVVGWGITMEGGEQPGILREVDIPILEKATCESMLVSFFTITETMICAGTPEGGKDACEGDSGGPLSVVEGEQHVLVGVSAFGEGCARPGIPGVYSRVSKYLDWIRENTQDAIYCP